MHKIEPYCRKLIVKRDRNRWTRNRCKSRLSMLNEERGRKCETHAMKMSRSRPFDFIMLIYPIDDAIHSLINLDVRRIIRELYRSMDGSFFFKSISI